MFVHCFFSFLSFSFIFHFLFLILFHFSFFFFHFLSFSFIFFHFLSFSFSFSFCWVLKIWFFLGLNFVTISLDSSYVKNQFLAPSLGVLLWALFSFFFLLCFSPFFVFFSCFTSCLSVGYFFVISEDQVESRLWWVAGGSSHTFEAESPDECARAMMGVTPQSSLFSLLSSSLSLFSLFLSSSLLIPALFSSLLCCLLLCFCCVCYWSTPALLRETAEGISCEMVRFVFRPKTTV